MRILIALLAMLVCSSAYSDPKADKSPTTPEVVTVQTYGDPCPSPTCGIGTGGVLVRYKSGTVQREWKVPDYDTAKGDYPDNYKDGLVVDDPSGKYVLAFFWTGGNHCCWPVLIFSLKSNKFLGEQIDSNTPLEIRPNEKSCGVVFRGRPYDNSISVPKTATASDIDELMPYRDYCFTGGTFKELRVLPVKPGSG